MLTNPPVPFALVGAFSVIVKSSRVWSSITNLSDNEAWARTRTRRGSSGAVRAVSPIGEFLAVCRHRLRSHALILTRDWGLGTAEREPQVETDTIAVKKQNWKDNEQGMASTYHQHNLSTLYQATFILISRWYVFPIIFYFIIQYHFTKV